MLAGCLHLAAAYAHPCCCAAIPTAHLHFLQPCKPATLQTCNPAVAGAVEDPCKSIHRGCEKCGMVRIPGTTKTAMACTACYIGWRLRRDGESRTCGECCCARALLLTLTTIMTLLCFFTFSAEMWRGVACTCYVFSRAKLQACAVLLTQ
jgi:hypothetical protein